MTQVEIVGVVVIGLGVIGGLVVVITTPFSKFSDSINKLQEKVTESVAGLQGAVSVLEQSVTVLNGSMGELKELFREQKTTNKKFYERFAKIESDLKDVQHNCQMIHARKK